MKLYTEHYMYDFYEVASALQKSIRRGDVRTAGFFALELFPKYREYAWRRLLTISAEDCYGCVTQEIKALYDAFTIINKKKPDGGRIFLSKAVILLCEAKKNRDADLLSNYVHDKMAGLSEEKIEELLSECRGEKIDVPEYVFDCHTRKGKINGKTKEDFFKQEQNEMVNQQLSLFPDIVENL